MKIVILDAYTENPGDLSWKALEQFGELTVYDRTPMNDEVEIIRRINYAEIVLTNKTPINARVIDACPSMKFISVLATGYNIVDYKYAAKKGITVSNVPAYGTASVAQFAIALCWRFVIISGIITKASMCGVVTLFDRNIDVVRLALHHTVERQRRLVGKNDIAVAQVENIHIIRPCIA